MYLHHPVLLPTEINKRHCFKFTEIKKTFNTKKKMVCIWCS